MYKKNIGGEFAIDVASYMGNNELYNKEKKLFSSGRAALFAILLSLKARRGCLRKILLPDYICASITQTVIDVGIEYCFYHIDTSLMPDLNDLFCNIDEGDCVLLVNYFGMLQLDVNIRTIRKKLSDVTIIVDEVQNFYGFKEQKDVDYVFNSYRKWFAVPDGAEVLTKYPLSYPTKENRFAQYKFAGNLLKSFSPDVSDDICLDLIRKGEQELDKTYNCKCSDISRKILLTLNIKRDGKIRKANAQFLHEELKKLGIKHKYYAGSIPLFVPVFFKENRDIIREELFAHRIFAPVHWPVVSDVLNGKNELYKSELSLICDQRYTIEDMKYMVEIIGNASRNYK